MLAGISVLSKAQVADKPASNDVILTSDKISPSATIKASVNNSSAFVNLNLEAKLDGENQVKIFWSTPAAYNSAYFIIQKRVNGSGFEDIIKTNATPSQDKGLLYSLFDSFSYTQNISYRIVEVKENGKRNISEPIMVAKEENLATISKIVFEKKEGRNIVQISGNSELNKADVFVASRNSELGIVCNAQSDRAGELTLTPQYDLPAGDYIVKLRKGSDVKRYKFSVKEDEVEQVK